MTPDLYQLAHAAINAQELLDRHLNTDVTDHEDLEVHLQGSLHGVNLTHQDTDPTTLRTIHAAEHDQHLADTRARLANIIHAILGTRIPQPVGGNR